MQKNLYYRTVLRRQNVLKNFFLDGFLNAASYPRLLLEVFVRRNFGERYFNFASAVTVFVLGALIPVILNKTGNFIRRGYGYSEGSNFWTSYTTWYLFLFAFLYFAWQRRKEVKRNPSVFDFGRFSLYSGDIHPAFLNVKIAGKVQSTRTIETLIEPGIFLLAGLLLGLLGQQVSWLLVISSLAYRFSYVAAYKHGDNFVMDMIDESILNEELESAFINNEDASNTRGVRFYARKPNSKMLRRKLSTHFTETDGKHNEEPVTIAQ
jgi:hypothetical protein